MVLLANKLATELEAMAPVATEVEGIDNFATAFENYFADSVVTAIPANPNSLTNSTSALKAAMPGANVDAAAAIQAGIIAFWGQVAVDFVLIWTTAPVLIAVVPPTGLGGIAAALNPVFVSNKDAALGLPAAAAQIAVALHPIQLGGIATLGPPPPSGTPVPIL